MVLTYLSMFGDATIFYVVVNEADKQANQREAP